MMACEAPDGVMDQEAAYLAQLENAASYESGGSTLIIANAEGEATMLFAAQE
jgi:heat shock protein HslJ